MKRLSTLLILLAATSCTGKKDSVDTSLSTVSGFCGEWANRACNDAVLAACVSNADQCKTSQSEYCESKIPEGKYSSTTANDCLDAVQNAYASATLSPDDRNLVTNLTGACSKILSGTGTKDDACSVDSDCNRDADLACVKKAGATDGKCEVAVPVDNGKSCSSPDSVCGDGFYCDGSHCVSGGGAGDTCTPSTPCGTGFRCDTGAGSGAADGGAGDGGTASPASATCVALGQTTDPCTADLDCQTNICVKNATTGKGHCADKVVLTGSDSSCAHLQ